MLVARTLLKGTEPVTLFARVTGADVDRDAERLDRLEQVAANAGERLSALPGRLED